MDKNLVYRSLHLHYVQGKNINETAKEVGLNSRVISAIVKGVRDPEVCNDFFKDRKTGDYSRSYPIPEHKKLGKIEYGMLENRYSTLICSELVSLEEISSYLLEDSVEPKQAEKILKTMTALQEDMQGKLLDKKLKKILNVLAQPSKWSLTDNGLETVYAVPVLDEKYNIVVVDYKADRSFIMPDELWERTASK